MYRVAGNMMESYYGEEPQRKSNLEMPHVTVNNRRMTNVQLGGGEVIQGIRRNKDLGLQDSQPHGFESSRPVRPLRYTPGLKCDNALEAMRPERDMKHQALQGGEWKRKLIQHPTTFEGSFADADMQKFRPNPTPSPMEDPWFVSRLPDQQQFYDAGQHQQQYLPEVNNPYAAAYPQDELSKIKMRNRRFQQSCAMEGMQMHHPAMHQPTMQWRGPVLQPPAMPQQMTEDMMMCSMSDELACIEQDLNMTRRATRPFVPTSDPAYYDLQRQVNLLETTPYQPIRAARFNGEEFLSSDSLPSPKPRTPKKEEPAAPAKPVRKEVGIADQIAIRSYVLGKNIGKVGVSN